MNIKKNLTSIALALVLMGGNSTALYADDTDIYLAPPTVARDDAPNILVIFDNSGSMEINNVKVKKDYDPSYTYSTANGVYTYAVKADGTLDLTKQVTARQYDPAKIYWWDTEGHPPSTANVLSPGNNYCKSSFKNLYSAAATFGLTSAVSATGQYSGDVIGIWTQTNGTGGTGKGNWKSLTNIDSAFDCKGDTNGGAADVEPGSGKYLTAPPSTGAKTVNYASRYTSTAADALSWGSLSSGKVATLYSGNYLNWYFGNVGIPTLSQSRMVVAKSALKNIINSNLNVNIGLMVFNQGNPNPPGGRVVNRIAPLTDTWRQALLGSLNEISGYEDPTAASKRYNYTPLAETLMEAKRYFAGDPVVFGGKNWVDSGTTTNTGYPRPYPDVCAENVSKISTNPEYCAPYNYSSINRTALTGSTGYYASVSDDGKYISPFLYECQQGYIILITDGDPYTNETVDSNNDSAADTAINTLTGGKKYPTPVATGDTSDTSEPLTFVKFGTSTYTKNNRLDDLAAWMYEADLIPNSVVDGQQRVLTYTVGFNGVSAGGKRLLQKAAKAGHGKYYDAADGLSLATSLQNAFREIQLTTSSFAAPSLSVNAFNKLFNRDEIYFALFKPSSTVAWDGNIKKLRLCNTQDTIDYKCSFGDIIDANNVPAIDSANLRIKDTSVSFWNSVADGGTVTAGGAGLSMQTQTPPSRNLYTYTGDYSTLSTSNNVFKVLGSPSAFDSTNKLYTEAVANKLLLDKTGVVQLSATATTDIQAIIDWMIGYATAPGVVTTTPRWPVGDPLHSRPVALTLGMESNDPNKPIIKLVFSTNDGQIHIINDNDGREDWAFIPKEVLGEQYKLMQDADGAHSYGADGSPSFWVVDNNQDGVIDPSAGDLAYMFIGMRRGGSNIYAFDLMTGHTAPITSKSTKLTPTLKWVIEGGITTGFQRLGQTWSTPQIRNIRTKCNGTGCAAGDSTSTPVLIFTGGYDLNQDTADFTQTPSSSPFGDETSGKGNAIYIVDPTNGSLIWWASSDTSASLVLSEMIYAIPSDPALFDTNGDGAVDRIFVGDMGGLVWRIDLGDQITAGSNGGSKGYVFADTVCLRNPSTNARDCTDTNITHSYDWRKLFYPPDIAQVRDSVFSTIPDYDVVVIATGNRADPVDKHTIKANKEAVHNVIVAMRDYNIATGPYAGTSPPIAIDQQDIMDLTNNQLQDPLGTNYAADKLTLRGKKGWSVAMKEATAVVVAPSSTATNWVGEKGLAKPVIFDNTIYVTTYTPANNTTASITCAATEGLGKIYALNLYDATATVDLNGDGTVDRSKNVGGGIPSELVTVIREGGVTGLVGTSGGAANPNIGEELPRGKTYWYEE